MKRPEVKIPIPDILRVKLVDDWEAVTKNNQVRQDIQETRIGLRLMSLCVAARDITPDTECQRDRRRIQGICSEKADG